MNPNVMDLAREHLTPDVINKIGSQIGETPEATQQGLNGAISAVTAAFVRHASNDPTGASTTRIMTEGQRNGDRIDDANALIGKGQSMLGSLFGERLPSAVDYVAHSSGLSQKSAGKILALAAPVVAAVIARQASVRNRGPAGMASMLTEQKGAVASALGAGGLGSIFGGAAEMETPGRPRPHMVTLDDRPATRRSGMSIILLGVLALLAVLMMVGRRRTPIGTTPNAPTEAPRVIGGGPSAAVVELNQFFSDPSEPTPKVISLEGVDFEHGSDRLDPSSSTALDGVAPPLQAHPTAAIRIDVSTDDTGNADDDLSLATRRANAVRDELVRRGVAAERITVSNAGPAQPGTPGGMHEGRVELVVTNR
jgi:outer membrane protein OmpA-like peptidoglycan-associated protein